jgi:hypothetical protein
VKYGDALKVVSLRAQQFDFAGEELFVERGEVDVLFDALQAAHAGGEVVDFTAQYAPEFLSVGSAREVSNGGGGISAAGGVAGNRNIALSADRPCEFRA